MASIWDLYKQPTLGTTTGASSANPTIRWSPDYSSFTTNPNAVWHTNPGDSWEGGAGGWTGWATENAGDPWDLSGQKTYTRMEDVPLNWKTLQNAGQWDLTDSNSAAWKYLQANAPGGSYGGGPEYSIYSALSKIGGGGDPLQWGNDPRGSIINSTTQALIAGGIDPVRATAIATTGYDDAKHLQYLQNKTSHGGISGLAEGFGDIFTETAPIWLAALGGYLMAPASGAAGGAAAGAGEAAAGAGAMSEGAAWGAGLTSGSADLAAMESMAFGGASGGATGAGLEGMLNQSTGAFPQGGANFFGGAPAGASPMELAGLTEAPASYINPEFTGSSGFVGGGSSPVGYAGAAAGGAGALSDPDWVNQLMTETGEAGQSAQTLESGFNPATQGGSVLDKATQLYNTAKPLLSVGGKLIDFVQKDKQADELRNYMAQQEAQGFNHRQFDPMAQAMMDPGKRMEMLRNTPGFQESQRYLMEEMKRKLAKKGSFSQLGHGDALSNNWAVPMGDVFAKHAMDWDKQVFDQVRDLTGMQFDPAATRAQLAGNFLPGAQAQDDRKWHYLGKILEDAKGIPDSLKGLMGLLA